MTTSVRRRDAVDEVVRVGPARPRIHVPTLLLGVLLVAGCALGFGLLAQRLTDGRPVVVAARPVERGQVVTSADLAVAQIGGDANVHALAPDAAPTVVGHTSLVPLRPGAIVTPQLFTSAASVVGDDNRTVGLLLAPGGYPTRSLAPGDIVSLVDTGGRGEVLDDDAVIMAVETPLEGSASRLIAVLVDADAEAAVSAAAAQDHIRLSLRGAAR